MKYSLDKYKFAQTKDNTIIAISTFAGKTVKGTAKCAPSDEFDPEKGKELAAARCNLKVAKKRKARASKKYMEAAKAADEAIAWYDKMKQYYMDAEDAVDEAVVQIEKLKIDM